MKKTCAVTLVRNWRSHSAGVEWEIPKLKEAPAPVIMPALLGGGRELVVFHTHIWFGVDVEEKVGNMSVLDQYIDFSTSNLSDFFSDVLSPTTKSASRPVPFNMRGGKVADQDLRPTKRNPRYPPSQPSL